MSGLLGLAALAGGVVMVAAGVLGLSRSIHQLTRAGVFTSLFWATFSRYAGFRRRSLRPALLAVAGMLLVAAGLGLLYAALVVFYSGSFLPPS